MKVTKRDGTQEDVRFDKIAARIKKQIYELSDRVEPFEIAQKVIENIYDGVTTKELDQLASQKAAALVSVHPDYSKLAARIAITSLHKETKKTFSQVAKELRNYVDPVTGEKAPLLSKEVYNVIKKNRTKLNGAIIHDRDFLLDYFGFRTMERAYLLKVNGTPAERPQHLFMRVAVGIHMEDIDKAIETYDLLSQKYFTHATPTLFNSGTMKPQNSSCFLLKMQEDSIAGIYDTLKQCALISQSAGGIGLSIHDIRAKGSYIKGTNGYSNGIVPMLRNFNDTARYVDQGGGKRKGSIAVYLEPWHADIREFLDLRKNTGKEELRARDLFYALWIPDLFMQRVKEGGDWTLMCPNECPGLSDCYGQDFEKLYTKYEKEGKGRETIKAQDLWFKILESQIETGTPYMLYKDAANIKSNQKNLGTIKSSNLCMTENQRVVTSKGYLTVKELYEMDEELELFDGEKLVKASKMKLRGKTKDVYKITLENGLEHTVTAEHGISVIDTRNNIERVETQNLKVGDKVAIQTKKGLFGELNMQDEAYLLGLYQSDGTQSDSSIMFDLWEHDFDLVDVIEEKVERLYEHYNYTPRYSTKGGTFIDAQVTTGDVKKKRLTSAFFKEIGFEKGSIPKWIWSSTEETQWEYIKGLLQADGTIHISGSHGNPVQLSYADINRSFLQELQLLFNNLGLQSSIHLLRNEGQHELPDGKGGTKLYNSKKCYRLVVGSKNNVLEIERKTGFLSRKNVILEDRKYRDNTKKSSKVLSIEHIGKQDVYCPTVYNDEHIFVAQGMKTFNCTEIIEYTDKDEVAVCNLASIALPMYVKQTNTAKKVENKKYEFDFKKLYEVAKVVTVNLNKIIDGNYYPVEEARNSNLKHRPIGIGVQGLADVFAKFHIAFDSEEARKLNREIFETIYFAAMEASMELAKEQGPYETFEGSDVSKGIFQFDHWDNAQLSSDLNYDWNTLKELVKEHGVRNSLLLAPMPTASTAQILGNNECFEPFTSNIYQRKVLSGNFTIVNPHLVERLISLGLWDDDIRNKIIAKRGSVQGIEEIPEDIQDVYRTVWEISQKSILEMAADRGAFICQSQSMNVFIAEPTFKKLTSMHFFGWESGLKTGMYYLRTKPAADAIQFTVDKKHKQSKDKEEQYVDYDDSPDLQDDSQFECIGCGA